MCLCREFNKRMSPNGLYQGRTMQPTSVNYPKYTYPKIKQTSIPYKRSIQSQ